MLADTLPDIELYYTNIIVIVSMAEQYQLTRDIENNKS